MLGPGDQRRRRAMGSMVPALEVWLLTVVAHTAVGGSLPSVPWLVSVAGLVALTTGWVVGRSASLRVMVPVLTGAQVALHLVLTWMPEAGATHAAHPMPSASADGSVPFDLSWRMVAAHVISAALTAVIWRLRRRAIDVLSALGAAIDPRPRATTRPVIWAGAAGFRSRRWLVGDPGRAPPTVSAAA